MDATSVPCAGKGLLTSWVWARMSLQEANGPEKAKPWAAACQHPSDGQEDRGRLNFRYRYDPPPPAVRGAGD